MATPSTILDSPNIVVSNQSITNNITGGFVNQADMEYLLSAKYSFTGSMIDGSNVGFGYGIKVAPTASFITYSLTTQQDFQFYVNGVRVDDSQVIQFSEGGLTNSESTLSLDLGYDIRNYDVVTGVGKFRV